MNRLRPHARAGSSPLFLQGSTESTFGRWFLLLAAMAFAVGFFVVTQAYWAPAHPGTDQNGYLVGGKMFAQHFSTGYTPDDPFSFVGRMWIGTKDGRFYPKYPIGLPVIYAGAMWLGTPDWPLMVNPICMALAIAGSYLLIRIFVGSLPALLGTILIATSPVTLALTNNPNSHASTLCCVVWGMYFLARWWQSGGLARAIPAGLLLGSAVTIRYTEAMLLLPVLLVAVYAFRWRDRTSRIQTIALLLAWAAPVAVLVSFNLAAFGDVTGYDSTNESTGFSLEYFENNWETMIRALYNSGLFFVLPLSILGLVMLFAVNWRVALLMAAWIVPSILLYTAYYWAPDGGMGYIRFFLTILPPLVIGAMYALMRLTQQGRITGAIAAGALVAIASGVSFYQAAASLENDFTTNSALARTADKVLAAAPAGSVLFSDERLLNFLQFAGEFHLYGGDAFNRQAIQRYQRIDPDAPQALQPQRAQMLYDMLKDSSEADLNKKRDQTVTSAFARGQRVFAVVQARGGQQQQQPDRRGQDQRNRVPFNLASFDAKVIETWDDPAPDVRTPRAPRGFGGQPNRGGRGQRGPGNAPAPGASSWQILEITPKAKPPTTAPVTASR